MDWLTDGVGERQTIYPAAEHEEVGNGQEVHPQRESEKITQKETEHEEDDKTPLHMGSQPAPGRMQFGS